MNRKEIKEEMLLLLQDIKLNTIQKQKQLKIDIFLGGYNFTNDSMGNLIRLAERLKELNEQLGEVIK